MKEGKKKGGKGREGGREERRRRQGGREKMKEGKNITTCQHKMHLNHESSLQAEPWHSHSTA